MPADPAARDARCEEIFNIQSNGLAQRLRHTHCERVVIGISGGLDSTLALLVAVRTFDRLGLDRRGICGITMPGFGTTGRTYRNALEMMRQLGVTQLEIPIVASVEQHFRDIGLPADDRSATYENGQARERTQILMDYANKVGGLVIGTGDLSELALGWATYNGDHMSMYGVNGSVPKTLVRHLVRWVADREEGPTRATLLDVIDTPVSPELLPADEKGEIAQKTEDLGGTLRAARLLPLPLRPPGIRPRQVADAGRTGLRRPLPARGDSEVDADLLPPLLQPAVQTFGPARRPEGGQRLPLAARRLADALRRIGRRMARRRGKTEIKRTQT